MANNKNTGAWLIGLPAPVRSRIRQLCKDNRSTWKGERDSIGQWWVRRSPTTGPLKEVTLLRKVDGITVREYPITVNGELVTMEKDE